MYTAITIVDELYDRSSIAYILIVALAFLLIITWIWQFVLQKKIEKLSDAQAKVNRINKGLSINKPDCTGCYWYDRVDDENAPCFKCAEGKNEK